MKLQVVHNSFQIDICSDSPEGLLSAEQGENSAPVKQTHGADLCALQPSLTLPGRFFRRRRILTGFIAHGAAGD